MTKDDILGLKLENMLKFNSVEDLLGAVFVLLYLGGATFVIAVIYSGIMYIMASGDATKAAAAKKNLIWAVTGLIIIMIAGSIIHWVGLGISSGTNNLAPGGEIK